MSQQRKWLSSEDVQRLEFTREGNPLIRALASRHRSLSTERLRLRGSVGGIRR
ncbi:hypothetical protein LMG33818_001148 [Halomonadaceae bacterium LMG 33818]|uniref:hypothetical protein n=1 Tax=Cernens ardua TaxID=3402176 RepID=UPI003EDCAB7E